MDIILIVLIAANVIISYRGFEDVLFFRKYEFHIGSIRSGEQYRMISSAFLHADWGHLLLNMLTFYFFAPIVESNFSTFSFLLIYFGSLIMGSLFTLYFHKDELYYRAVGASGAVVGILYSAILLYPDMTLSLYFIIPIPAYLFAILYLGYSIFGMKHKGDNIGHTAHFGGAIGGFLITLFQRPQLLFDHTFIVLLLLIPIVVLFYMHKTNKI